MDNLIGILMHADVSKRDITEPCVFAWNRNELILLPTNSVEYQESLKHTEKQGVKFSAKDLVVGYTYGIKQDSTTRVVYLGHLDQYAIEHVTKGEKNTNDRWNQPPTIGYKSVKKKKKHVFINEQTHQIDTRDPSALISGAVLEEMHPEFATLMDHYYSRIQSQPISGVNLAPDKWNGYNEWYSIGDDLIRIRMHEQWARSYGTGDATMTYTPQIIQYAKYDPTERVLKVSAHHRSNGWYNNTTSIIENPTTLHEHHPQVLDLKKRIQEVYDLFPYRSNCHWEENNKRKEQRDLALKEVGLGGSRIQFVLADGKTTNDSVYI